jgi:hypothetical protein
VSEYQSQGQFVLIIYYITEIQTVQNLFVRSGEVLIFRFPFCITGHDQVQEKSYDYEAGQDNADNHICNTYCVRIRCFHRTKLRNRTDKYNSSVIPVSAIDQQGLFRKVRQLYGLVSLVMVTVRQELYEAIPDEAMTSPGLYPSLLLLVPSI